MLRAIDAKNEGKRTGGGKGPSNDVLVIGERESPLSYSPRERLAGEEERKASLLSREE